MKVTGVNGLDEVVEDALRLNEWDEQLVDQTLNAHKGKIMLFDFNGKLLSKVEYDEVDLLGEGFRDEGLACVSIAGKWGYIDKSGKEVIPCKYDDASNFSEGLACVSIAGKCGYIDKSGKEVIPCKYDDAGGFREGLALVKNISDGRNGLIDSLGREFLSYNSDYKCHTFSQGFIALSKKWRRRPRRG